MKELGTDRDSKGRKIFIYKCLMDDCSRTIRIRNDYRNRHTWKCRSCSKSKRPFETVYSKLFLDWRKTKVELTYEEYLEFTKIKNCHYCDTIIPWENSKRGKKSQAYFLDRKNNNGSYSKENCVVCCTSCNRVKSNRFSYIEFVLIGKLLKRIYSERILYI